MPTTRRELLAIGAGATLGMNMNLPTDGTISGVTRPPKHRPRIAVLLTQYAAGSHGVCYCTKLLEGKQFDDHYEAPLCDVASIHLMEIAKNDVGVDTAKRHNVKMYPSIATALCCGGDTLAVDGVAIIGEHGNYPVNEKEQMLYPRREMFDQVVNVFRQSGRVVPIFNDKHLSWNWEWAKYMWRTIQEMKIPYMAGSSLPFAKYTPFVPLPRGQKLDHVIAIGYGGFESYGFHSIETGQFVVEKREGGEKGVKWIQFYSGKAVWEAMNAGVFPKDIAEAAFSKTWKPNGKPYDFTHEVFAYDIEYLDGQRLTVLMPNGYCQEFGFAYRVQGESEIVASSYMLDDLPRLKHFSATTRALEEMYISGKPTAPSSRCVLTTGILAYGIESKVRGGVKIYPKDLKIAYQPLATPEHWKEVLS
ncbi:MAG: hypothetical protein NT023_20350 [Armatimonadetes bacterium]|nr:hypothetical protein [Armatimonadota bacterium]